MLRVIVCILMIVAFSGQTIALAQASNDCSPATISSRIDGLENSYRSRIADASDTQTALQLTQQFQTELSTIIEQCSSANNDTNANNTGTGTLSDPYSFGYAGDTGEGFSLRVTSFIKPADSIVHQANMFNDRPREGQVYVIYDVELNCFPTTGRCGANYLNFQLVGDQGVIYETPAVVLDNKFDVKLLGGASGTGKLVFLVNADDTNLKLLYLPNIFENDVIAYHAESAPGQGIQVSANSAINIRNAPNTNGAVVGSLSANTPIVALGRNTDGTWLQIPNGWVFAELVTAQGDVQNLPVTAP